VKPEDDFGFTLDPGVLNGAKQPGSGPYNNPQLQGRHSKLSSTAEFRRLRQVPGPKLLS